MKNVANQSPKASADIVSRAKAAGIAARLVERSGPQHRRHRSVGSTHVPQKVVMLDGIRMSLGQAKQYVAKRER